MKNQINKVESQGTTNGVPNTAAVTSQLACPPTSITSFSPLSGNTGTIVQVNGVSFNGATSVTVNGVSVPSTGFTVFNDTTLRFNTPIIGTGTVVNKGKIVIVTPNGTVTSTNDYTFDPSITASAAASPGGYNNPQNQTSNAPQADVPNANQQLYGPEPLISTSQDLVSGKVTEKVTISVNPQVGAWVLDTKVEMTISIFDETLENNKVKTTLNRTVKTDITNYVNNNIFTITYNQIADMLINVPISQFAQNPIRNGQVVTIEFCVTSSAVDEVKYPNKALRCVNFYFKPSTLTPNSQPATQSQVSIISLGESPNIQGNDFNYTNIKKPAGGYITLKLDTGDQPFNFSWVGSSQFFKPGDSFPVPSSCIGGPSTEYTKVCTVNGLGVFTLVMEYYPKGFAGDMVLVTSPPFTL